MNKTCQLSSALLLVAIERKPMLTEKKILAQMPMTAKMTYMADNTMT